MKSRAERVLLMVVVLILYGSTFPWHFRTPHARASLFRYWDAAAGSYLVHDVAVNVALYVPLGLTAGFVFDGPFGPVLLGLVLASAIEIAQLYIPGRQAAVVDILANTAGAVIGSMLAVFLRAAPAGWAPRRIPKWVSWAFLLTVVAVRVLPLHFVASRGDFQWVPFGLLLEGNAQTGLMVLAAKAVCYTGAIWLFRLSGWGILTATALVIGVVTGIEVIRVYAPETWPGITDPVVAAIGGFLVASLYPETKTQSRSAG